MGTNDRMTEQQWLKILYALGFLTREYESIEQLRAQSADEGGSQLCAEILWHCLYHNDRTEEAIAALLYIQRLVSSMMTIACLQTINTTLNREENLDLLGMSEIETVLEKF